MHTKNDQTYYILTVQETCTMNNYASCNYPALPPKIPIPPGRNMKFQGVGGTRGGKYFEGQ